MSGTNNRRRIELEQRAASLRQRAKEVQAEAQAILEMAAAHEEAAKNLIDARVCVVPRD